MSGFEFLFLGVKNNSKNFGNKKNYSWGWFESEANEEAESGQGNSPIYDKHVEDQVLCVKCSKIWNNKYFQIVLGWFGFKADWSAAEFDRS